MNTNSSSISRRELLKRGGLVGGAVLWVAPAVQVVGMSRAYAKETSPNCSRFCLKWEVGGSEGNEKTGELTCTNEGMISAIPVWTNQWNELGGGQRSRSENVGGEDEERGSSGDEEDGSNRRGTILTCPRDGINDESAARRITSRRGREFVVYGSMSRGFWIAFPNDITPASLGDEAEPWTAAVKCGQGNATFEASELSLERDPCYTDPEGAPFRRMFMPACNNGKDISHMELIIDWCPSGSRG